MRRHPGAGARPGWAMAERGLVVDVHVHDRHVEHAHRRPELITRPLEAREGPPGPSRLQRGRAAATLPADVWGRCGFDGGGEAEVACNGFLGPANSRLRNLHADDSFALAA